MKIHDKPKVVTVLRKKWYRGLGSELSRLRKRNGMMCCLGFWARACGVPEHSLTDVTTPNALVMQGHTLSGLANSMSSGLSKDLGITQKMIAANDSATLTDAEREKKLKALSRTLGVTMKFK